MASIDAANPDGAGAPNVNAWSAAVRSGFITQQNKLCSLSESGRRMLAQLRADTRVATSA
jgi:hypothetical protein